MSRVMGAILAAAVLAGCSGNASVPATPAATDSSEVVEPAETIEPEPTAAPITLPASYKKLTKRGWQKLVKSPDKYVGKGYKLWACIYQFDAATGDAGFLGYASYKKQAYWFADADNAAFTGDASKLSEYVEGDIVSMSVASVGSYSYDTQIGGNTTVPAFQVVKIKREKGSCD